MDVAWTEAERKLADQLRGGDVISIRQFQSNELNTLLDIAERFEGRPGPLLQGRVLACLFFEPSTRTRLSFESAMARLGGSSLGFASAQVSSASKGESLADTIRMAEQYADILVVRHPHEGAARLAAEISDKPIINGGDGSNQHPTQTLLDLYTIRRRTGRLTGLKVGFLGDLKYGRAAHGIIDALAMFGNDLVLISPDSLRIGDRRKDELDEQDGSYVETDDLDAAVADLDVLYVTRIQRERFGDPLDYERVKNAYRVDNNTLALAPDDMVILHPLPRVHEIHPEVDLTSGAAYFQQAGNGVTVRKAVLSLLAGVVQ